MAFESQALLDGNPDFPTYELGHVSLGKLLNFSEVWFLHQSNAHDEIYLPVLSEINRLQ